jgi:hypothetical protein
MHEIPKSPALLRLDGRQLAMRGRGMQGKEPWNPDVYREGTLADPRTWDEVLRAIHTLNNELTGVVTSAGLLCMSSDLTAEDREIAEQVKESADSTAECVRKFMDIITAARNAAATDC